MRPCENPKCGKEYEPHTRAKNIQKFCSQKCQIRMHNIRVLKKIKNDPLLLTQRRLYQRNYHRKKKGIDISLPPLKNSNGRGTITKRGYRNLRGRPEHRTVWEKANGRKLEPWEDVHHKDGDRLNNHPDNLIVKPRRDHKRSQEVEDIVPWAVKIIELYGQDYGYSINKKVA